MRKFFGYFSELATFTLVALTLIVGPLNFGSRSHTAQALLHIAVALLLVCWLIRVSCLAEPVILWPKVALPLLVFFGYVFVRYAFCEVKWVARQEMLMWMCYSVLFLSVINNLQRRWQLQGLFWVMILVAAAEAGDGVVRYYKGGLEIACRFFFFDCAPRYGFQNLNRAGGTFWTPDHFAACLELAFFLIAGVLIVLKRGWTRKIFSAYLGMWILLGLALSRSRGAWLSLLCTVPFFVGLVVRGRFLDRRSGLIGAILLAGVVFFLYKGHAFVAPRLLDLIEQGEPSRWKFYTAALEMGRDHPVLGVGPQMYGQRFWQYRYHASEPQFAHCMYLQVLADYGLLGVVLMGWLVVVFYRSAFRIAAPKKSDSSSYLSNEVSQRLAYVVGGTAAVFVLTVHSAFDFVLHVMGVGVAFAVVAALIFAAAGLRRKRSETDLETFAFEESYRVVPLNAKQLRIAYAVLGVLVLFFVPVSVCNYLSLSHMEKGKAQAYHRYFRDSDRAEEHYNQALRFDPRNYQAALWLGNLYYELSGGDYDNRRDLFDKAMHWYTEAVRLNPYYRQAVEILARRYFDAGQLAEARAECEKLMALCPDSPIYHMLYGEVCLGGGDRSCAKAHFERALALDVGETFPQRKVAEAYLRQIAEAEKTKDPE